MQRVRNILSIPHSLLPSHPSFFPSLCSLSPQTPFLSLSAEYPREPSLPTITALLVSCWPTLPCRNKVVVWLPITMQGSFCKPKEDRHGVSPVSLSLASAPLGKHLAPCFLESTPECRTSSLLYRLNFSNHLLIPPFCSAH